MQRRSSMPRAAMRRRRTCTSHPRFWGRPAKDKPISKIYLPDGRPLNVGDRVVKSEYAETLTLIAKKGEGRSTAGRSAGSSSTTWRKTAASSPRGSRLVHDERARADPSIYRGGDFGRSPPAASGVHITQMLQSPRRRRRRRHGSGCRDDRSRWAEGAKIGAPPIGAAASGDPDFINVPVERLTSKDMHADERARGDRSEAGAGRARA